MLMQEFFHVFEMQIGMNEFDHRILALLKPSRFPIATVRVFEQSLWLILVICMNDKWRRAKH